MSNWHTSNWHTYSDSGSSAADNQWIYVTPQDIDWHDASENSGYITIAQPNDWSAEIYIDDVPIGQRITELQSAVELLWDFIKKIKGVKNHEDYYGIEEVVKNFTKQEKVDLDEMEKQQEKKPLDDELFEI